MDLLKNNKRFSFKLDGAEGFSVAHTVHTEQTEDLLSTMYEFEGGLRITNVAKKYGNFGAYEWVNYIENIGNEPTGIISELFDCDITLPIEHEEPYRGVAYMPDIKTATKIYAPAGSSGTRFEFSCEIDELRGHWPKNHILPGQSRHYATSGGRSSNNEHAPFFNIHKNGKGYIFAIGWTGQWNCDITRDTDTVTVKTKIEDTNFRVLPGEKFRTSSVVLLPYEGDIADSQNIWRRLVKNHFSLIGKEGRDEHGPLCTGLWGGLETNSCLDKIKNIKEQALPFEYVWMDAGWFGDSLPTPDEYEGDWWQHTGNWNPSKATHPDGLCDVSRAAHEAGMKYLLWFEPERVRANVPIVSEHPEYFLKAGGGDPNNYLLDLGNESAWNYCFDMLCDIIEKLDINCYRQDFNFEPLGYWRTNDTDDRRGISEIKHINGMYRLWDALLEKFPHLIIDNCASGGRRIDIETLRRSIPLWRSDLQCPANFDIEGTQNHTLGFGTWMPYSGTGSGRPYDEYRIRSAYSPAMTTNYFYSDKEKYDNMEEKYAFIKKYTQEYLRVRPYLSEDFYPLTELSVTNDTWCAYQFHDPSQGDGIVQIFRRENSPYDRATLSLRGLCPESEYVFSDADGGEFAASGKDILENGLEFVINKKRCAKLYFYRKVK